MTIKATPTAFRVIPTLTIDEAPQAQVDAHIALVANVNAVLDSLFAQVNSAGGELRRPTTITGTYQIATTDGTIHADNTLGGFTATLPSAVQCMGFAPILVQDVGGGTFTVAPLGTDTISGGGSIAVTTPVQYESDGVSNWRQIG